MEKKFDDNDEMQIDLLELAYALKKKLWLIILGLIVGAFGAGLYSKILLTPIYNGLCTFKGNNSYLTGRPADRQPAYQGLQRAGNQPSGIGAGD